MVNGLKLPGYQKKCAISQATPPQNRQRKIMMPIQTLRRKLWSTFSDISGSILNFLARDITAHIWNSQIVLSDQIADIDLLCLLKVKSVKKEPPLGSVAK